MRIINRTNIEVNRLLELLANGYPVSDLEVYILPPQAQAPLTNGLCTTGTKPKITIYVRQKNEITYLPKSKNILITNAKQYIAYIFLHEFFHYMARRKKVTYKKEDEEPMADQYAMNRLRQIGIPIDGTPAASTKSNQLEQIMHHVPEQNLSGTAINIIPINHHVIRDSIGFAYRDIKQIESNGAITQTRNFYLKKFDCGHYCTSTKTFGLDCTNPLKGTGFLNSGPPYHIVCARCVIPEGCHKCGIPGCRLCLTKHENKWYCQDCMHEITGGWLWALLKS